MGSGPLGTTPGLSRRRGVALDFRLRTPIDPAAQGAGNMLAQCHPTHATNLMTMKIPTARTAVSAQDIPTRMAI
jgi:hypothetical protein